jgi:hypothetical protein
MSEIVDNLKKLCEEHEKQLMEIRDKIAAIDLIPKAKALVGQCYKSPNNYSGYFGFGITARKVGRKSYVYRRIVDYDKEYLIVDTFFQETPLKFEVIFREKHYVSSFVTKTLIPISEKEYFKAFDKMLKFVHMAVKKEK